MNAGKGATQKDEGGLDDLISAIRTGKAFGTGGPEQDRSKRRERAKVDKSPAKMV